VKKKYFLEGHTEKKSYKKLKKRVRQQNIRRNKCSCI